MKPLNLSDAAKAALSKVLTTEFNEETEPEALVKLIDTAYSAGLNDLAEDFKSQWPHYDKFRRGDYGVVEGMVQVLSDDYMQVLAVVDREVKATVLERLDDVIMSCPQNSAEKVEEEQIRTADLFKNAIAHSNKMIGRQTA